MKTDKPLTSVRDVPPRAWHKEDKAMYEVAIIDWRTPIGKESGGHCQCIGFADRFEYPSEVILMWPTGLHDKNGTEIYEGDITEIMAEDGKKNRFVVRWGVARRIMDTGWEVDIPGFYFDLIGGNFKAFPIVKNYKGVHDLSMTKVIGNSLQHPDLLKKE